MAFPSRVTAYEMPEVRSTLRATLPFGEQTEYCLGAAKETAQISRASRESVLFIKIVFRIVFKYSSFFADEGKNESRRTYYLKIFNKYQSTLKEFI